MELRGTEGFAGWGTGSRNAGFSSAWPLTLFGISSSRTLLIPYSSLSCLYDSWIPRVWLPDLLKALAWNWHSISSATFSWSKPVIRLAQSQKREETDLAKSL